METGFRGYHPVANLIFFAGIVVFGLLFKHPATLAVCFSAALCYYIKLCGKAAVKSFFLFLLPMLVFVLLLSGFTAHYGVTALFTLPNGNDITLEAVVYGFVLGLMTVTVIMWFFCYNEVVTADKFMFVFGRFLPAAALVISMTLRFIPMYKNRLKTIAEAQRGIGMDYKTGSIAQRIKNGGKIISILITWSLENAIETSDSMRARGYGLKGRKNYGKFRWSAKDITFVIVNLLLDVIITFGYVGKALYCEYNPEIRISELSAFGIITLAAFAVLCFLPLIIDLKEDIKWNRLKLRI